MFFSANVLRAIVSSMWEGGDLHQVLSLHAKIDRHPRRTGDSNENRPIETPSLQKLAVKRDQLLDTLYLLPMTDM